MSLPAWPGARAGFRREGTGRYLVWALDPLDRLPWFDPDARPEDPVHVHFPGGAAPLVPVDSGRREAVIVPGPDAPLIPLRFGGRAPPSPDVRPFIIAPTLSRAGAATDVHAHVGTLETNSYEPSTLEDLASSVLLQRVWVSNLDGSSTSQRIANERLLSWLAPEDRPASMAASATLVPVFWANPTEGLSGPERELLAARRFAAFKFHPVLNRWPADDRRVEPYLELAAELGMPALFHTDLDPFARPRRVAALAARFPGVRFIMGHTGLWGAQEEALICIRQAPHGNLFGDLAWFHRFDLLADEIEGGRSDRFVFGSDAPVDGEDSYQQYLWVLWRIGADQDLIDGLFAKNPARLAAPHERTNAAAGRSVSIR